MQAAIHIACTAERGQTRTAHWLHLTMLQHLLECHYITAINRYALRQYK